MNLLITYLKWCVFHKCARLFQSRPGARCLLSHLLSDLQANQCDVAKSLPGSKSICERGHPCSLWSGQNLLEWCTAFVCKIFPQGYCVLSVPDFWPPFDHCCANALWNAGKACCDNQQWAFSRFGLNCAEPINFTFQRRSIPPCRSSPTPGAGGSNPFGRTKSSTLWGAALFVLHRFYGAVKEGIRTARAPRFASRGAETPQWGVSRARLGESLRAHSKTSLQCAFAMRFFSLMLFWF